MKRWYMSTSRAIVRLDDILSRAIGTQGPLQVVLYEPAWSHGICANVPDDTK